MQCHSCIGTRLRAILFLRRFSNWSYASKDDFVGKGAIPLLSADNFDSCLFCQDYSAALKALNTLEEDFIARAHAIDMFLN